MHESVYKFARDILIPGDIKGKDVVEAGSRDENGTLRLGWDPAYPGLESYGPASWLGADMRAGPGVDLVCDAADLPRRSADLLICTEMLEHASSWRSAIRGITAALRPGGLLLLTTRSPGFPYHQAPEDYWRFPVDTMAAIITACGLEILHCEKDTEPVYPGVFALARSEGREAGDLSVIEAEKVER